ncbi:hypothetical protein [Microbacterium sp.]|uniref:hypothetical protein n=1 Tax=Microbacterium sp. TaxID=51671 RepID=UPI003F72284E
MTTVAHRDRRSSNPIQLPIERGNVMPELRGDSTETGVVAVTGSAADAHGVLGVAKGAYSCGVYGQNEDQGPNPGPGVLGKSRGTGVWGESETWVGVYGKSNAPAGGNGVWGEAPPTGGSGVYGLAHGPYGNGVFGQSDDQGPNAGAGVFGRSRGTGVWGESETWMGVYGKTTSVTGGAGVMGEAAPGVGAGVLGKGGLNAGYFEGNVTITGDLILPGADYAEELPASDAVGAGQCVVLDDEGSVRPCTDDYDTRVAGIVSGAGGYKPAIVLDRQDGAPIALMGKAFVWVDADRAPVRVGDMLTTSSTPGHAMKVRDGSRAFGAVIGKALTPLESGRGLVKVFVSGR